MRGRRLVLPGPPARVVSLAPSLTEIAFALGAGDRLVGVTDYCDYPPEARAKPRIGGTYNPSLEAIVALRPDLVLATTEGNREEHVRALEQLGVPVFVVRPVDLEATVASMEHVARVLARDPRPLTAWVRGQVEHVTRAVAGRRRPRVLYVVWGQPLIVPGRRTLITELIRRAGGESVTADEPLDYPRLSAEEALARAPEVVVLGRHGAASVADRLEQWPFLRLLPAVRQGRVYHVDGDLLHRPGPRLVEGLRRLAAIFHPDVALGSGP